MYRAPHSDQLGERPLDWAMERIAQLVKQTRDETFVHKLPDGTIVNHTLGIGSLGGATLDNEENYLIKKLFSRRPGDGLDREPGPRLTQLIGAQSGCHLRPGRGDAAPSGTLPTPTASW